MKNIKVYIFNSACRAANYGIGTYINQLTLCLKKTTISFEIINLNGTGKEVTVTEEKGYRQITIPIANYKNKKESEYYYRNATYLLGEYIIQDKDIECIFHLNFMSNPQFISCLRKRYKCKIVLVCHYTNWSFSLLGDEKYLLSIVNNGAKKRNIAEKQCYNELRDDIKMIKQCDKFICVAKHSLNTYLKVSDIDNTKCQIINNALEDEYRELTPSRKQALRSKWQIPDNIKIILFVGRLDEVKGIGSLIKAFKKLLKTNPNTRLILVGDGNYSEWLAETAEYCTKVTFTGRLCKEAIRELYQIADIGVIPSIHEEFGLVAIEMMMHKIPIITGNTGGLTEIIENSINGLKVQIQKPKGKRSISPQLLSANIKLLVEDEKLASEIGCNGRKSFLEKYEISLFKNKMETLYNNL